jgi:hypothetical protein
VDDVDVDGSVGGLAHAASASAVKAMAVRMAVRGYRTL